MTDKQILGIASQFLTNGMHTDAGWVDNPEWTANTEQLLLFAERLLSEGESRGYEEGRIDGYSAGYDAAYYEHSGY